MQDPNTFYTTRISELELKFSEINERLMLLSILRFAVFALTGLGAYLLYGQTLFFIAVLVIGFGIFLYLVSKYSDKSYERDKIRALLGINRTEIEVLQRNFHHLPDGNEFNDPAHHFSRDIDLFGRGSFYQYCNRTALHQGRELLAHLLKSNDEEKIPEKQEAVKELANKAVWRQEFQAVASLVKTETSYDTIIKWMKQYQAFVPKMFQWLPHTFGIIWAILITAYALNVLPGGLLVAWFFVGLILTGRYLKKTNRLASDSAKILSTFQQYQRLIVLLEEISLESKLLAGKRSAVLQEEEKTSLILKRFARLLNALDQRNNIIIALLGNALFLRDLFVCNLIEGWIAKYGLQVENWFTSIAFFDAYNTLGNFAFNHPHYCFPKIIEGETRLKATEAVHPLLDPKKSIANDFEIKTAQFFIITGANMAGKSTFLRTVSLQIVMGNLGLPLAAKEVTYNPIKLVTSMRTADSLTDEESYFFSELKRLKFIIDELANTNYFIVLDEILKGTNSTDKAKGSKKFLEQLVRFKSEGMIATHDLSLCKVADELEAVKNYYFDAEIINDELHFDYVLKEGICQNMNASFLLKKMKIVE